MSTLMILQLCQSNMTFLTLNKNNRANACYVKSGSGRTPPKEEWWKEFSSRPQCAQGMFSSSSFFFSLSWLHCH